MHRITLVRVNPSSASMHFWRRGELALVVRMTFKSDWLFAIWLAADFLPVTIFDLLPSCDMKNGEDSCLFSQGVSLSLSLSVLYTAAANRHIVTIRNWMNHTSTSSEDCPSSSIHRFLVRILPSKDYVNIVKKSNLIKCPNDLGMVRKMFYWVKIELFIFLYEIWKWFVCWVNLLYGGAM